MIISQKIFQRVMERKKELDSIIVQDSLQLPEAERGFFD